MRVLLEPLPRVRTASIGLWFQAGSRDDPPRAGGAAHFLEHLVFKGGRLLGARRLAEAMDALGGQFNAFTTREHTCFHARTLGQRLPEALALIAEMVVSPRCDPAEVQRERSVILEELSMIADDPAETADELFAHALWGEHPLGRPQAGSVESVRRLDAGTLRAFHSGHYVGTRCVVAAAGRLQADRLLAAVESTIGGLPPGSPPPPRIRPVPLPCPRRQIRRSQQAHLVLGAPGPDQGDPQRWTAALFTSILGGSPSSRLFQTLREERGLCYDVGASSAEYSDSGEVAVFLATAPSQSRAAAALVLQEIRRLAAEGPTAAELDRHRDQLVAAVHMSQDGTEARMSHLGRQAVAGLPLFASAQVVAALRHVSRRAVQTFARDLGDPADWAAAFVGPQGALPGPWAWEAET